MLKIIKKSEYQELLDYKEKYERITGQRWFIISGGRTMQSRLMQLSKESLINLIMELRQDIKNINKRLKRNFRCRVEKVDDSNE